MHKRLYKIGERVVVESRRHDKESNTFHDVKIHGRITWIVSSGWTEWYLIETNTEEGEIMVNTIFDSPPIVQVTPCPLKF